MAADQGELGYWSYAAMQAEKKKRKEAFEAACGAMKSAMGTMNISISQGTDDETVDILEEGPSTSLLSNVKLTEAIATKILAEVKELQNKNPMNTEFLTNVVNVTAEYIRHPTQENLGKYEKMQKQVETKYGRHAALTGLLLGLPASMVIGGMIGATFMCAAFPGFIPVIAAVSIIVILAATIASAYPANKVGKIAMGWDDLKKEMNIASSRPSFK